MSETGRNRFVLLDGVASWRPELLDRVKLYTDRIPLFDAMGIEPEIELGPAGYRILVEELRKAASALAEPRALPLHGASG